MKKDLMAAGAVCALAGGVCVADDQCAFPFTTGDRPDAGTVSYAGVDLDADGVRVETISYDLGSPAVVQSDSGAGASGEARVEEGRLYCEADRASGAFGVAYVTAYTFIEDTRPIRLLARWDVGSSGAAAAVPPGGGFPIDGVFPTGNDAGTYAFTLEAGSYLISTDVTAVSPPGGEGGGWISLEIVRACDVDSDGDADVDDIESFVDAFLAGASVADCDGSGSVEVDDIGCYVDCFLSVCP